MTAVGVIIVFLGGLIVIASAGYAFHTVFFENRKRLRARAETVMRRQAGMSKEAAEALSLRREPEGGAQALEKAIKRYLPRISMLKKRLNQTGRQIPVSLYLIATLALGIGGTAGSMPFAPLWAAAIVGATMGLGIPWFVVGRMAASRANKFNALFPDAIDLIVRGIRSGLPVTESVAAVGRELADPVGAEFRTVADSVRFGAAIETALWETADRLATDEFRFFVVTLSVQKETGGNLAETLANLSDVLRKRRQLRLKIRAMAAEGQASAMILGSLPFIMFIVLGLISWQYVSLLFNTPEGRTLLHIGIGSLTIGLGAMYKLVRFRV